MASQLRVDEIIASTGSSVAIGTAGGSVTLAGDFTVDTSKGLNVGTGASIFSPSSNVLTLGTNNAERVRITSSGNVGINETSPDRLLHITVGSDTALAKFENSASSGRAQVQYVNPHGDWVQGIQGGTTTGDFLTYTADSKNIRFYTDGALRQKIQGDGKIIVGGNADQAANRNLSVVAASGNSNNTEIGLQPTNSSGGYNPEVIIGTTADGTYGAHMFFTTRDTSGNRSERLRITSSGNIGIGLTNPTYSGVFGGSQRVLHISGTAAPSLRIQSSTANQGDLSIQAGNSGADVQISNMATNGDIVFYTHPSGSINEAARFTDSGNLKFPSGQGIDFSANSNAAGMTSELLDDYEEGTWTPTQGNLSTWSSPTFSANYTKIGRLVYVQLQQTGGTIGWSAQQYIAGLPFSPAVPGSAYATDNYPDSTSALLIWTSNNIYFHTANASETGLIFTAVYHTS